MKQDHRDKAGDWFRLLARMGPRLPVNYGKYLRDGVWELRVAIEHHQHRFLFSFLKKSREVPDQEIERSRKNMAEFIRRQGWEEI
ncbi:MAG: type II toxin-antitoxin system RelE/ParE family toxin [Elusimicrobia bacterium]|nr:type II toxin-antitoxin system RelE/ParE family toxin [Elusimicrobiota bacterium]